MWAGFCNSDAWLEHQAAKSAGKVMVGCQVSAFVAVSRVVFLTILRIMAVKPSKAPKKKTYIHGTGHLYIYMAMAVKTGVPKAPQRDNPRRHIFEATST